MRRLILLDSGGPLTVLDSNLMILDTSLFAFKSCMLIYLLKAGCKQCRQKFTYCTEMGKGGLSLGVGWPGSHFITII